MAYFENNLALQMCIKFGELTAFLLFFLALSSRHALSFLGVNWFNHMYLADPCIAPSLVNALSTSL
jgi:hypothetical protein